jgi:hypothetical protein
MVSYGRQRPEVAPSTPLQHAYVALSKRLRWQRAFWAFRPDRACGWREGEKDDWSDDMTGWPGEMRKAGGIAGVQPRPRLRELDTERRRAWRLGVGERCAVVLCSCTAYLVSFGAALLLAYFAAHLVALWMFGSAS